MKWKQKQCPTKQRKLHGSHYDLGIRADWFSDWHYCRRSRHAFWQQEELTNHFARSAELLDNMAHDYRQLYQHMAKGSNDLLPNLPGEKNPFAYQLTEAEADNDQAPVQMPRDYSDGASGLLRGSDRTPRK